MRKVVARSVAAFFHSIMLLIGMLCFVVTSTPAIHAQLRKSELDERERQALKVSFQENFRELQLLGINLLKSHRSGELDASRLNRDSKAIQKRARALRGLMVLGNPEVKPLELPSRIKSEQDFSKYVGWVSRIIYDFAHSPIHTNTKVFDTELATKAATDLVNIGIMAKLLESSSVHYLPNRNGL